MRFPLVCHTNKWFVPAAFRARAVVAAKRRPLESPADDQRARLFRRHCRLVSNLGPSRGIAAAEKEAKKAIYNFFVHFVARHGKYAYGGEYLNECKKKVDNFNYREMKVGLAPFRMVVASIVLELRGLTQVASERLFFCSNAKSEHVTTENSPSFFIWSNQIEKRCSCRKVTMINSRVIS